jgi:hypothetical protein
LGDGPVPAEGRDGRLVPLASGRGDKGAIPLYADGFAARRHAEGGQTIRQKLPASPPISCRPAMRCARCGKVVTANARDGVAVVDQDEIEIVALEDAEIVLVETDRLN